MYKLWMEQMLNRLNNNKDKNGANISPILSDSIKNYLIDIDGTITEDIPNEEPERMINCQVFPGSIEIINMWYENGNIITFFTSRIEEHRKVTETWLNEKGFKYHGLLMNKPRGGNYSIIDNHLFFVSHFKGDWEETKKEQDSYVHKYR